MPKWKNKPTAEERLKLPLEPLKNPEDPGKSQGNPKKYRLNARQAVYLGARVSGNSQEESKRLAGYGHYTSTDSVEKSSTLRSALLDAMDRAGISSEYIAKKLRAGLNAKKRQYFVKDGKVSDSRLHNDHDTQQKYFRNALEIRGDIKQNTIDNLNVGIIAVPSEKSEAEWNKGPDMLQQETAEIIKQHEDNIT